MAGPAVIIIFLLLRVLPSLAAPATALPAWPSARHLADYSSLVDVRAAVSEVLVDLAYTRPTPLLPGFALYPNGASCLLTRSTAAMLKKAARYLASEEPNRRLLLLDCLRPQRSQILFWKKVQGTPGSRYVANPYRGHSSLHTYGCSVDLTLADKAGQPLDLGTPFDTPSPLSGPRAEPDALRNGKLTAEQVSARRLLRAAMRSAGFISSQGEWWHFDCARPTDLPAGAVQIP